MNQHLDKIVLRVVDYRKGGKMVTDLNISEEAIFLNPEFIGERILDLIEGNKNMKEPAK